MYVCVFILYIYSHQFAENQSEKNPERNLCWHSERQFLRAGRNFVVRFPFAFIFLSIQNIAEFSNISHNASVEAVHTLQNIR